LRASPGPRLATGHVIQRVQQQGAKRNVTKQLREFSRLQRTVSRSRGRNRMPALALLSRPANFNRSAAMSAGRRLLARHQGRPTRTAKMRIAFDNPIKNDPRSSSPPHKRSCKPDSIPLLLGFAANRKSPQNLGLWCREGESNPHSPFGPADFKSAASANFAIPATRLGFRDARELYPPRTWASAQRPHLRTHLQWLDCTEWVLLSGCL
jgi:hypothetical protein